MCVGQSSDTKACNYCLDSDVGQSTGIQLWMQYALCARSKRKLSGIFCSVVICKGDQNRGTEVAESKHNFIGYEIAGPMTDKLQTSQTEEEGYKTTQCSNVV